MSDTAKLYQDFWAQFDRSFTWPAKLIGTPHQFVHRSGDKPKGYYEFDGRLPLGYRARAIISKTKNQLRAEILTNNKEGVEFVSDAQSNDSPFSEMGLVVNWHIAPQGSDAKIELNWENAGVECSPLWPAHHVWLRLALERLATLLQPQLHDWEKGRAQPHLRGSQ